MIRLYLFAEGQTEQTFADIVLKPHLANLGVFLHSPVMIAHTKKKRKIHRGGGSNYLPMKNDICRFLKQEKNSDVYFTIMIDYYGIHQNFPGLEEARKLNKPAREKTKLLESRFGEDIGDQRFIPHLQLHEYEAYLFADTTLFGFFYDDVAKEIAALKAMVDAVDCPESIDDGPDTAPSKRIIGQFPDYDGAKPIIGPQLADLIGLKVIREKCPHFDAWLSRLEVLNANRS